MATIEDVIAFFEQHSLTKTKDVFLQEWSALSEEHNCNEQEEPATHEEVNEECEAPTFRKLPEATPEVAELSSHEYGVIDCDGTADELWEVEDHNPPLAPIFHNGGGIFIEQYDPAAQVEYVQCNPYQKEPPPTDLPLESFDLRVVYDAGKTGFEEPKDFPIVIDSVIAGRYQVLEYLGSAAFSRAVQCMDLKYGYQVCMKIIRNSKDFFDQSLDEIKLLQLLNSNTNPDEKHILQLYDYFYYKEHTFLVCELLRDNLYEFAKYNREQENEPYFTLARVQSIARQVLVALEYLHSLNLIHCDLKPENILIKSYSRCEVKVIDFGSSCYLTDQLSSYIQSRCYRAPEVVLGCHYDGRIDVWSLGAILPELLTGQVMFHNDTVAGMLARIAGTCGPFSERMLHEGRHSCRFVTKHGVFYDRSDDDVLTFHFPKRCPLEKLVGTSNQLFLDFVKQCLTVDPRQRPTAKEMLKHPFLEADFGPVYSPPPQADEKAQLPH